MKHWMVYLATALTLVIAGQRPFTAWDVGRLRPAQTLCVSLESGRVVLRTDSGDLGRGGDWAGAMEDLESAAPGRIFLGTVDFLLLEDSAQALLPELLRLDNLNPGCELCRVSHIPDLETAGQYLTAHRPESNLRRIRGEDLPLARLVLQEEGRYGLVQPGN